jgi:molybdopterin synthase sulfur carrier subunit
MRVALRFFAAARESAGVAQLDFEAPTGTTVAALLRQIGSRGDGLSAAVGAPGTRIAVNQELIEGDLDLHDGDEVAFLPPVTGG